MTQGGLRERKKEKTRTALIDAAFELFLHKGFDATTIDEIAAAVEVSPRTFFRYFASKEEVALSVVGQQLTEIIEVMRERPANEPVMTAFRHAAVHVFRAYEEGGRGFDPDQIRDMNTVLLGNPVLATRGVELSMARLAELAETIAHRMGVDPDGDPRPYLVASAASCGVQATVIGWRAKDPSTPVSELVARAFDLMSESMNYPAAVTR